jgi:Ni2+-binding GTPase involved in maturation of urease and hydrogenase
MTEKPWIVLVGGFLGAGKTTLLLAAARELERRGLRSALILNDQGEALVDAEFSDLHGFQSGEVTGGCFCCRFSDLLQVIDRLREHFPDVIFAEPVGSCTDISATTLHPLLEFSETYRIAPYTVLVDPVRADALLFIGADSNLRFIFEKQLQEADLICITKSDIYPHVPQIGYPTARQISAKTGQGVAAWLDEVLSGGLRVGSEILNIDYEQYAQAEAALAWLNAELNIRCRVPQSPAMILGPFFDCCDRDFTAEGISIVHMKAIVHADSGFVKAAICANGQAPTVEGMLDASPALDHHLLFNLRAVGEAGNVRQIVETNLASIEGDCAELRIRCFHPAAPKPERRVSSFTSSVHSLDLKSDLSSRKAGTAATNPP